MKKEINFSSLENRANTSEDCKNNTNYEEKLKKAYKNYQSLVPLLDHIIDEGRIKYTDYKELINFDSILSKSTKILVYKDFLKSLKKSSKKDIEHSKKVITPLVLRAEEANKINIPSNLILHMKKYFSTAKDNQKEVLKGIKITSDNLTSKNIVNLINQEQSSHEYLKYFEMLTLMYAVNYSIKHYNSTLIDEQTPHRIIRNTFEDIVIDEIEACGITFFKPYNKDEINNTQLLSLMREEKEKTLLLSKNYTKK